ncbi:hypothetical protein [Microvirga calopogonii]|uniref:hypothetical protein n=1 Tax=Microvirga calopogonii TaxID=2078013 RepID=UPI00197B3E88|nr:hypothetical protein [Microvirga calopogonii]
MVTLMLRLSRSTVNQASRRLRGLLVPRRQHRFRMGDEARDREDAEENMWPEDLIGKAEQEGRCRKQDPADAVEHQVQ